MHMRYFALLLAAMVFPLFAATLSGRVENDTGAPLDEAQVSIPALNRHAHTDKAGNFQFKDLPRGLFVVKVSGEGAASKTLT
ncbi:MAG TPA: carboxypeptidase regulatory-like domain-containing protein, partial [Turneriella sp.]|nr:carboxypeptidase regulatory-like domain-containing protein [Turneriella sp.]